MKKNLLKVTAPAIALGLVLSVQSNVGAASPNSQGNGQVNGTVNLERLIPIEKRISSVDMELDLIVSVLGQKETLSEDQYDYYQEKLISLNNRVKASTNQLSAVLKKADDSTEEIVDTKNDIDEALIEILEAQELLNSIEILPEEPIEESTEEVPTEESTVEVPTEEGTEEVPTEEGTEEETTEEGTEVVPTEEGTEEEPTDEEVTEEETIVKVNKSEENKVKAQASANASAVAKAHANKKSAVLAVVEDEETTEEETATE